MTKTGTAQIAVATLVALSACGSAHSAGRPSASTSRVVAPSTQPRTVRADPSRLVLRADDYPTGKVDEQGRADLYDEPPASFEKVLEAAGLQPGRGAFTRSFHIAKIPYGRIDSLAVVLASPRIASQFFRAGAPGLLVFDGFAGGTADRNPIPPPAGAGSEAVAFQGRGVNGGVALAIVWVRNSAVGVLIVDRSQGDPRPELDRLSRIMDRRMAELA